jgi:hypothetical protein
MPVIDLREVLVGTFDDWDSESVGEYRIMQKKLNLEEGYRYQVKNVQVFDDNGQIVQRNEDDVNPWVGQLTYVTPYPIVLVNMPWGINELMTTTFSQMGPFAGDRTTLFKSVEISTSGNTNPVSNDQVIYDEFPNHNLELLTPSTWYTPHLYLTVIQVWGGVGRTNTINKSFYIEMKKTRAGVLERSMGVYKEMLEAQARIRTTTGNFINPVDSAAGRSFPSWLFGGIRSEIMINSTNVLRYYNKVASRDYQAMMGQDAFRERYKQAINMVPFDAAFGTGEPFNIPEWITVSSVSGVSSGPIRDYPPPTKYTGSGNTVMYDKDGNPASVVT